MTAQIAEKLHHEGQAFSMCTNPLNHYFALGGVNPHFESNCTALWRGYVGTWEIIDARLYLIDLQGNLKKGGRASVATLFPDFPDRVFAHWYSGTIRIPQGKMLEYVRMGYGSIYERDILLEMEKGVIKSTKVQYNGTAEADDGPEGYEIGAMSIFASAPKNEESAS